MMYGKLINGVLQYAPSVLKIDGKQVINPSAEQLQSAGYMMIVEAEKPDANGNYMAKYNVADNKIVQSWEVVEVEKSEIEQRVDMLEGCILEMSEMVYA